MKKMDILWNALLFGSLLGYFLVMVALGLNQILSLRYVNIVFQVAIIYWAMKAYRVQNREPFSFLNTGMVGIRSTIPAILLFTLFQFVYLRFIDPGFMTYIKATLPMGEYLNPPLVVLGLVAEGVLGTFFASYVCMRLIAAQEKAAFPTTL